MQAELFDAGSNGRDGSAELVSAARVAPAVKRNGRRVPPLLVEDAMRALEHFNAQTGRSCQPFTGRGKPSESLSRIIGAMLDYPAVRIEWRRMIDRCLADPWWDGPASTGCIFGPRVVEASLARAQTPTWASPPSLRSLTPSGQAIAKLLAADAGQR
jgi:hypothetical protein